MGWMGNFLEAIMNYFLHKIGTNVFSVKAMAIEEGVNWFIKAWTLLLPRMWLPLAVGIGLGILMLGMQRATRKKKPGVQKYKGGGIDY